MLWLVIIVTYFVLHCHHGGPFSLDMNKVCALKRECTLQPMAPLFFHTRIDTWLYYCAHFCRLPRESMCACLHVLLIQWVGGGVTKTCNVFPLNFSIYYYCVVHIIKMMWKLGKLLFLSLIKLTICCRSKINHPR